VQQSPIVEIGNVSFSYDPARPVLRDIDLEIARGSVGEGSTTNFLISLARSARVNRQSKGAAMRS
jgi:hypothetical protein